MNKTAASIDTYYNKGMNTIIYDEVSIPPAEDPETATKRHLREQCQNKGALHYFHITKPAPNSSLYRDRGGHVAYVVKDSLKLKTLAYMAH